MNASVQPSSRLLFIDCMRGIAIVWMIETHVVNTFMPTEQRHGLFFDFLNISNGFVSVAFIFCAGCGFTLLCRKKEKKFIELDSTLFQYVRRLFFIFCAGYLLNMPTFSLQHLLAATPEEMQNAFRFDILQLIAASSFCALSLIFVFRKSALRPYIFAAIAALIFLATPFVWYSEYHRLLPTALGAIIAPQPISPFPFFPWSGYFFGGAAMAAVLTSEWAKTYNRQIIVAALLCIAVIFALKNLGLSSSIGKEWWYSSPEHFLFRLSGAVVLAALLLYTEKNLGGLSTAWLIEAGRESLFVYIMQGVVIFSILLDGGLFAVLFGEPDTVEVIAVFFSTTFLTMACAKLWSSFKRRNPRFAAISLYGFCCFLLLWFALAPPNFSLNALLFS